jgi:hypothetical protein
MFESYERTVDRFCSCEKPKTILVSKTRGCFFYTMVLLFFPFGLLLFFLPQEKEHSCVLCGKPSLE